MLFLFTQGEKDTVDKYGRNFQSLWDTVEAFGGSPGIHKGLVDGLNKESGQVANLANITANERKATEEESNESVKAALLISGAEKCRYGKLKDELANNYLLGTDQYPDIFDKALHILGNYQNKANHALQGERTRSGTGIHPTRRPKRPRLRGTRRNIRTKQNSNKWRSQCQWRRRRCEYNNWRIRRRESKEDKQSRRFPLLQLWLCRPLGI